MKKGLLVFALLTTLISCVSSPSSPSNVKAPPLVVYRLHTINEAALPYTTTDNQGTYSVDSGYIKLRKRDSVFVDNIFFTQDGQVYVSQYAGKFIAFQDSIQFFDTQQYIAYTMLRKADTLTYTYVSGERTVYTLDTTSTK